MASIIYNYKPIIVNLKINLLVVIASYSIISFGDGLVSPMFTRYLETLGATPVIIGSIESLKYIFLSMSIFGGYLADKIGRKRVIIISHIVFSLSLLWLILASDWRMALMGIILLNVKSLSDPAIDALVADDTSRGERGRTYSLMWVVFTLATIISSSILIFIINKLGVFLAVKMGFVIYFIIAILTVIMFYLFLEETHLAEQISLLDTNIRDIYGSIVLATRASSSEFRSFILYYLVETPARLILMTFYILYLEHIVKANDVLIAFVFSSAMILYLSIQIIIGPLIDNINRARGLFILLLLTFIFLLVLLIAYQNIVVSITACVFMIVTIFLEQYFHKILMADITVKETRGISLGLIKTISGIQSILSLIIGGFLFEINPFYPFILSAVSIAISLLTLIHKFKLFSNSI